MNIESNKIYIIKKIKYQTTEVLGKTKQTLSMIKLG